MRFPPLRCTRRSTGRPTEVAARTPVANIADRLGQDRRAVEAAGWAAHRGRDERTTHITRKSSAHR
jgi:hypothetical protein